MKILMTTRYGFPQYGCEKYFLNLCSLLKEKGHEVIVFTTKNDRNIDKEYSPYCDRYTREMPVRDELS